MKRPKFIPATLIFSLIFIAMMTVTGCPFLEEYEVVFTPNIIGPVFPPPPPPPQAPFQTSVFSPDGQWVYFIKDFSEYINPWPVFGAELWKINIDGTGAQLIFSGTTPPSYISSARISPNGQDLFITEITYSPTSTWVDDLWFVADLEAANAVNMNLDAYPWTFNVSPDGQTLLLSDVDWAVTGEGRVLSIDIPSAGVTVIATDETDFKSVAFSPDGTNIAGISGKNPTGGPTTNLQIKTMNADGSGKQAIYTFQDIYFWPDVSHAVTNDWIYFSDYANEWERDVFRISWDGSVIENLTNTPDASEMTPIVRPDQGKVLYSSYSLADNYAFWEMDLDGANKEKLVGFAGVQALNPQYSPDGNTIVYETGPALDYDVGIFTRGVITTPTKLTNMPIVTHEAGLGSLAHQMLEIPARRAEAYWNLKSVATAQFVYFGQYGEFTRDFNTLGWQPMAGYRYSYKLCSDGTEFLSPEVLSDPLFPDPFFSGFNSCWPDSGGTQFSAVATANIDGDLTYDNIKVEYTIGDPVPQYSIVPAYNDLSD